MSSSSTFLQLVFVVTLALNTLTAPVIRQRRDINDVINRLNIGSDGTAAFNRAWQAAQTGKVNTDYKTNRDFKNFNNFNIGGQVSGGIPLIYNGPSNPSLGLGGAASGSVGRYGGNGYRQGPDFGVGLGYRHPIGSGGAYFGLGAGTSFGSSYSRPNWGVGATLNIPIGRK